jgi:hypothetical protein
MSEASRIPLLDRDAAPTDSRKVYDTLLADRGVVPNMFKVLGYRPEIAQGVAGFLKPLRPTALYPAFSGTGRVASAIAIAHTPFVPTALRSPKRATELQIESVANFESGPYRQGKLGFRLADRSIAVRTRSTTYSFAQLKKFSDPELIELFRPPLRSKCFPLHDGLRIPITLHRRPRTALRQHVGDKLVPMTQRRIASRVRSSTEKVRWRSFSRQELSAKVARSSSRART